MIIRVIIEGYSLGLSTGLYCLNACLPLLLPYMFSEGKAGVKTNLKLILWFVSGRLAAYIIFAALVSVLGRRYQQLLPPKAVAGALILTSIFMISYALIKNLPQWHFCRWAEERFSFSRFPFVLGFLIGINICPPFLAGTARLLEMGNAILGILFFISFFFATTLYILPLAIFGKVTKFPRLKEIGSLASLIAGVWFFATGVIAMVK